MDLDHPALEFADVADTLQITGKNPNRESAQPEVIAEVQKVNSALPLLDPSTLPMMHLTSPMCFLASSKGTQSGHASLERSRVPNSQACLLARVIFRAQAFGLYSAANPLKLDRECKARP
jgi:hypothetical protein